MTSYPSEVLVSAPHCNCLPTSQEAAFCLLGNDHFECWIQNHVSQAHPRRFSHFPKTHWFALLSLDRGCLHSLHFAIDKRQLTILRLGIQDMSLSVVRDFFCLGWIFGKSFFPFSYIWQGSCLHNQDSWCFYLPILSPTVVWHIAWQARSDACHHSQLASLPMLDSVWSWLCFP